MKQLGDFLLRTLNIEPGEAGVIVRLLLFSFFIGIALSFFFTVSISSFLVSFESTALPNAYIFSGLLSLALWLSYERLRSRFAFSTTVLAMLIVLVVVVAVLAVNHILYPGKTVSMALLVWVAAFMFIKNVAFWSIASQLFNVGQGKRLFGMINSGEVISNIIGFFSVPVLLPAIGPAGLFAISIAAVTGCVFIVLNIIRKYPKVLSAAPVEKKPVKSTQVRKDNFFRLMLPFSVVPVFLFYLIDFQFLSLTRQQFGNVEAVATFMGFFLGTISVAELLLKSVVFSKVLRHYGLRTGLSCLCICLLFAALVAIVAGGWGTVTYFYFSVVALCKLLERSVSNGIHAPSVQLLYQPVSPALRARVQGKIEGMSAAIGNLAAGAAIHALLVWQTAGLLAYMYVVVIVLAGWPWLISSVYSAYKQKLQEVLLLRRDLRSVPAARGTPSDWQAHAADNPRNTESEATDRGIHALASGSGEAPDELEAIFYKTSSTGLKLRILEAYAKYAGTKAVALLCDKLDYPSRVVQLAAVKLLSELNFTTTVTNNVVVARKITEVAGLLCWIHASMLDLRHHVTAAPLLSALQAEKNEYMGMLFTLLGFSYGPSTVKLIRNNLADNNDTDDYIFALEIAANTFEEEIRAIVFPLIEKMPLEKSVERLSQHFPQQKLSAAHRAVNILYKDYAKIGLGTKTHALQFLEHFFQDDECRSEIRACLFHESGTMRETAREILASRH
ncbi:hypothetical protein KK083_31070 [Fulvivirgaceae bacterium PWU4]|uniref:MFS transporter n=1 Tax=Chryseosolibacter histidini TaxID=2782349 RepID=A0AAP2GMC5_9BACT|nr:hypothetical protein [Chryseosolibacter histidini]MBT1701376.1 hypothetical protein [Chryseosolibacter histidini]